MQHIRVPFLYAVRIAVFERPPGKRPTFRGGDADGGLRGVRGVVDTGFRMTRPFVR